MARPTHQFSQTKTADIPRSSFDLSHGLKTTFDAGLLIPILSLEVLPGDTINCRASLFGRLATPIKPILDNMYLETFFFFTPYRQVWDNWTKFMGEQDSPGDSTDFSIPRVVGTNVNAGTIRDYMGLPLAAVPDDIFISALPFRCYNKIFNFWFRDENLVDPVLENTDDGPDAGIDFNLKRRRKRRDYITSGLPFPQKGPDVTISLGQTAPVIGDPDGTGVPGFLVGGGAEVALFGNQSDPLEVNWGPGADTAGAAEWGTTNLIADLASAAPITINALRESFQIQKLLERDARGGTRYPEILRSHFQVSDPGLLVHQRPLFLGGGSSQINITPVAQTTDEITPGEGTVQGNLAAYGTVSGSNHGFTASFTEHGHVLGLVNVRADLTYQQGLERYWSRQTRYDFYWPALSHLGEQQTRNSEVFVSNDEDIDNATFAYMPRYDEYRFKQSQITGLFRSDAQDSLDVWHLAQDFATLPALNTAFIEDNPPIDRVIAVQDEPQFILDLYFKIKAARPLPLYATPGLIDHF